MSFFQGSTPVYYGDGAVPASRRESSVFGWLQQLLGFPASPTYQYPPPDPVPQDPTDPIAQAID